MIDPAPRLITVFGGSGFIGRYVCEILLKAGVGLRVAEREPRRAYFLQPLGGVGQVAFASADLARPESLPPAVQGAFAAVNLVGILKGNFHAIHVAGAKAAAEAARDAGASAFVHISAIGADPKSESAYGRSKGEGEAAVRAAFPSATIIRPSLVFGPEDQLTNRFAGMARFPLLPVIAPRTRFQPVYCAISAAIAAALEPSALAASYESPPRLTCAIQCEDRRPRAIRPIVDVPDSPPRDGRSASAGAPLTHDQFPCANSTMSAPSPGREAFGMTPSARAVAHQWLARFPAAALRLFHAALKAPARHARPAARPPASSGGHRIRRSRHGPLSSPPNCSLSADELALFTSPPARRDPAIVLSMASFRDVSSAVSSGPRRSPSPASGRRVRAALVPPRIRDRSR